MTTPLESLSNVLSENIANTSRSTVAIQGRHSAGTGIHWRQGLIVTSCEALNAGDRLHLHLPNGQTIPTEILGSDPTTDIAILSLPDDVNLPVASLGDSQALALGQLVSTVGYAIKGGWGRGRRRGRGRRGRSASKESVASEQSVAPEQADSQVNESSQNYTNQSTRQFSSVGIVSQIEGAWRSQLGGTLDQYIEVSLNLRRGSAGAPLINASGEVVGFNTFGPRRSILAIPATTINKIVDQLQQRGRLSRGYLGLGMQIVPLPENVQQQHDLNQSAGIMVVSVEPESAADRAGMVLGDVMVAVDEIPLESIHQLQAILSPQSVGQTLSITLLRAGNIQTTDVVVGER